MGHEGYRAGLGSRDPSWAGLFVFYLTLIAFSVELSALVLVVAFELISTARGDVLTTEDRASATQTCSDALLSEPPGGALVPKPGDDVVKSVTCISTRWPGCV